MKLILQESITGLGNPGDLVQVKSGYGRNYLLPTGKAIVANEENMKVYEAKQEELKLQEEKRLERAKEIFDKINEFSVSKMLQFLRKAQCMAQSVQKKFQNF